MPTRSLPPFSVQSSRYEAPRGFTLLELMAVLAISLILVAVVAMSIPGLLGSQKIDTAVSDLQGMIDMARTQAMAQNTYTWLGLFEQNPDSPGTAGIGQLAVSIVSSVDGTQLYSGSSPTALPGAGLTQVQRLMLINGVHLADQSAATQITRSNIPADGTDEVGNSAFDTGLSFTFPTTGTPKYTFTKVIQFNPQGEATRPGASPAPSIEIILQPAHNGAIDSQGKNVVVLQIGGIVGHVSVFRP